MRSQIFFLGSLIIQRLSTADLGQYGSESHGYSFAVLERFSNENVFTDIDGDKVVPVLVRGQIAHVRQVQRLQAAIVTLRVEILGNFLTRGPL